MGKVIDKLDIEIGEIRKQNSDLEKQGTHGNHNINSALVPKMPPSGALNKGTFKDFMNGLGGLGGSGAGPSEEV
jgi:hypothetical protein